MKLRVSSLLIFVTLSLFACGEPPAEPPKVLCSGSESNCQRRYDEVAFAATHNAFSYAEGGPVSYLFPNQDLPIAEQLARGIRGLGIRPCPYYGDDPAEAGRVYVTHNFSLRGLLGMEPLLPILVSVRTFLEKNPGEVVTLFAESAVTPKELEDTFIEAGLLPYLYTHDKTKGFPTLAQMKESGQRLVVFSDSQDKERPPWQLFMWDFLVDTDYNITDIAQFSCDFYRGEAKNPLYFLNNFIYRPLSGEVVVPDRDRSQMANDPQFMLPRAEECWKKTGRRPNFLYVDWFGQGDVVGVTRALNEQPR
jgi:hypothetical protein